MMLPWVVRVYLRGYRGWFYLTLGDLNHLAFSSSQHVLRASSRAPVWPAAAADLTAAIRANMFAPDIYRAPGSEIPSNKLRVLPRSAAKDSQSLVDTH